MYFPELVNIGDQNRQWVPTYGYKTQTKNGPGRRIYQIREAAVNECPKSIILRDGGWAVELVNQYIRSEQLHVSFGEMLFGMDRSQWPAWVEDVMLVLHRQKEARERARAEDEARFRGQ